VKNEASLVLLLCAALLSPGCATVQRVGGAGARLDQLEPTAISRANGLRSETKEKILALNPEHVTECDIRELLSQMPAPQIINIHGGLLPIKTRMNSFARFLIGMGYPEASLRHPRNGDYTYGYYDSSDRIAGTIGWYYERDGLRPMMVGHSLGGIQAVRVLHELAGDPTKRIPVWNPLTESQEQRCEITDPLTGTARPVVGLQLSYATAAAAGGLARVLPNEWDMNTRLRDIPDSVEEFTGFHKGLDLLGGDFLGYGPANDYHSTGNAIVRNVPLPAAGAHLTIPDAKDLLKSQEITDWINNYQPAGKAVDAPKADLRFGLKNARILWAAEVWHGIKKHWVIELQRLIRARLS